MRVASFCISHAERCVSEILRQAQFIIFRSNLESCRSKGQLTVKGWFWRVPAQESRGQKSASLAILKLHDFSADLTGLVSVSSLSSQGS